MRISSLLEADAEIECDAVPNETTMTTTKTTSPTPSEVYQTLLRAETTHAEPDVRRIMRDARVELHAALNTKDWTRIRRATTEGLEHLEAWGLATRKEVAS